MLFVSNLRKLIKSGVLLYCDIELRKGFKNYYESCNLVSE